jgi:esterase/lipase superfamily enzyme
VFWLSGCSILSDLAPAKDTAVNVHDWVVVPVFYRTNRSKTDAGKFSDIDLNHDGRFFGVKNVIIPMPDDAAVSKETAEKMGWQFVHVDNAPAKGTRPPIPPDCKVSDREMSAAEIIAAFNTYRRSAGQDHVVLFVHGCCATFDTSIERTAKIAVHMQLPLVAYDWVSPTGFSNYLKNETLADQELDDFDRFLINVEKLIPAASTSIIGHSLGARFVDSAMVRRWERIHNNRNATKYDEVIFSNADIDAEEYIAHCADAATNARQVRIYINTEDGRLHTSELAHGYPRLGRPEKLLPALCQTANQDVVDVTAVGAGHEMPFEVVADMHRFGKLGKDSLFSLQQSGQHLLVLRKQGAISQLPAGHSDANDRLCECSTTAR